jgi:hypothetical protein
MATPEHTVTQEDFTLSNAASGSETANLADDRVQRFATGIYRNEADKTYGTWELSELRFLPKSLFYDGATSKGVYQGLFAYYVLGKRDGGPVKYELSETTEYAKVITPVESRNPTAKRIIEETSKLGGGGIPAYLDPNSKYRGQIYNVKDFVFCKHYGVIPNNRMLTLRRFPSPTLDSLRIAPPKGREFTLDNKKVGLKEEDLSNEQGWFRERGIETNAALPVSQAVTYFGEGTGNSLTEILNITTGLNFASENQEELKNDPTGDPGLMNSPFGDLIKSYIATGNSNIDVEAVDKIVGTLANPERNLNKLRRYYLDLATSEGGPLSKKIFVNVNTVDKMLVRKQGFVGGTEQMTLTFEYNLTSVGRINTKMMFLDLMTNLLSLGSDYGQFLSPELRLEQNNVGVGFPGGAKGYVQSITDPVQYIKNTVSKILSSDTVNKLKNAEAGLKQDLEEAAQEIRQFANNPEKGLDPEGKFYKSLTSFLTDAFLKKVYFQPLMLSGYPVGEWHLVVGNPLNPIAMMGNLVCQGVKISFNEDLGPDDFPTEMKAVYTLAPGRQRHRGDWESAFNRGNGRLYLGQLVESKESYSAFMTANGVNPNDPANLDGDINSTIQLTSSETN